MDLLNQFEQFLKALGLSEYELKLYAASVDMGRATASRLAKKTGIPRSSVYSALERLQEKGLIALEQKRGVQAYLPSSPQTLVSLAQERVTSATAALSTAKELSRVLESSQSRDALASSKILIFEGKASVRAMILDWQERWREAVVNSGRPWTGFQDESYLKHYGDMMIQYWRRFEGSRHESRNIVRLFQEQGEIEKKFNTEVAAIAGKRRQLRAFPGVTRFSATLWIAGEYLVLLKTQSNPHYALQIRDKLLADNVFAVFQMLWQMTG